MREVTLEITQYCNYECSYCSSCASPDGEHLSFETIEEFIISQRNKVDIERINISGGEPLAHPDFFRILQLCRSISSDVRVYTNALEHIVFNSLIIKNIRIEANVCLLPGHDVHIPEGVDEVKLLQLVPQGRAKALVPANIKISSNITDNCENCNHILLQSDGQIVAAPCKKEYC